MEAKAARCSACGALVGGQDVSCPYCRASLSRVACAKCFGLVPVDANNCPSCGTPVKEEMVFRPADISCPSCRIGLEHTAVGGADMCICGRCGGAWLDRGVFENLIADRERRGLAMQSLGSKPGRSVGESSISYRPCPVCGHLMNRINYARISGVIIDICKEHGVWFDRDELQSVLGFIEQGGLLKALERERMKLDEVRRESTSAIAAMPVVAFGQPDGPTGRGRIGFFDVVDFLDKVIDYLKR